MDLKSFGQAIRELAEEKGVPEDKVVQTIELAIAAAYKKDYGKKGQMIRARFNPHTGDLHFAQIKTVVDESMIKSEEEVLEEEAERTETREAHVEGRGPRRERDDVADEPVRPGESPELRKIRFNPERHIMLDEAQGTKADAAPGDELEFPLETKSEFGRIASQTAKQVIIQRIREAEREATYGEYKGKEGEIVSGTVQRLEGRNVYIDLGRGVAILPPEEQLPRERYQIGGRLKALLALVEKDTRGPGMFLSRSHPRFLKKLFELEVPEIASGTVEIKAMAREPGSRSKLAVASNDPAIDPVGSMVGQRGVRVSTVINEIGGEKIDIIEWADDHANFVANSLSPAKVIRVELSEGEREARVIVPEDQLSLAIGKGGQNVRLAAKLTGWKIDVRSNASPVEPMPQEMMADTAPSREEPEAPLDELPGSPQPTEDAVAPTDASKNENERVSDTAVTPLHKKPAKKKSKKSEPKTSEES